MSTELILDPQIRTWVFLPIPLIAFLVGTIRHHVSAFVETETHPDLRQIRDNHLLVRARLLQRNSKYIPHDSFSARRHAFNNPLSGYFKEKRSPLVEALPLTDPRYLIEMMKGNFLNVVSMLLVGGWITLVFSGFLTTKVPFGLTLTFQSMLQRGVELSDLEASWVSSASWYFLNVFCMRSFHNLFFADNGIREVKFEDSFAVTDTITMMKEEWEGLEMVHHEWALENNHEKLLEQ